METRNRGRGGGFDGEFCNGFSREATAGSEVGLEIVETIKGLILAALVLVLKESLLGDLIGFVNLGPRRGCCGGAKHRASIAI